MDIPRLETDRLILRGPREADYPVYRDFYADPEGSAAYGGPLVPAAAWKRLAGDLGHWLLRGYGMWSVERKSDGAMAGGCGLVWPDGWPRPELTWWVVPAVRRQGIALEASRAVIAFGYDVLGWDRVETHMDDGNDAARNLALKLGGEVCAREVFPDGEARSIYALPRDG